MPDIVWRRLMMCIFISSDKKSNQFVITIRENTKGHIINNCYTYLKFIYKDTRYIEYKKNIKVWCCVNKLILKSWIQILTYIWLWFKCWYYKYFVRLTIHFCFLLDSWKDEIIKLKWLWFINDYLEGIKVLLYMYKIIIIQSQNNWW